MEISKIEADLTKKWEALSGSVTDYASFVKNEDKIEDFYELVEERHAEMCTVVYQAALSYSRAILASDADWGEKYDKTGSLENEVYDDMFDTINDVIYDGLLKDMEDHFYEGVLRNEKTAGVPYGDWFDTRSDEYGRWYDCRSGVYSEWYDSRSDVFGFKYDLAGELWSKDADGSQRTIDRFEKKVNKRLSKK